MTRRQYVRELAWSAGLALASLAVAVVGRPQPFAIVAAGLGWLTAAYIAVKAINDYLDPGPPTVPVPPDEDVTRATLRAEYPIEEAGDA